MQITEALKTIFSNRKVGIYAKEAFCDRYPTIAGTPTPGCGECGLGELNSRNYSPLRDFSSLERDYQAFSKIATEGTLAVSLLGGELLQGTETKTSWPSTEELIHTYHIKPEIVEKLRTFREKINKPMQAGIPMEMWERDGLLAIAMVSSLEMIPQMTSNFDLVRDPPRMTEILQQLKIAGLQFINVSWHTMPGTTLAQNKNYFDSLIKSIKYCERTVKIPTILTRVFRGFGADPDIFLWQREVANRYVTNDISLALIRNKEKGPVFFSNNSDLQPKPDEIEMLELFHLLNAIASDQPRIKTVFQAIFEHVFAETGWRCNIDEEHFEFIDTTPGGVRSNVCSEVRGKEAALFPGNKSDRLKIRRELAEEGCPTCLSRCYTFFDWRDFQKDPLHLWLYAQAAGKMWRQMYGREKPFRHLVIKASDYLNPDLLERIIQFRFRYFAGKLEDSRIVALLKRSGVDIKDKVFQYYQDAVNPNRLIALLTEKFAGLPPLSDETSLQSRLLRKVAYVKHKDPSEAPIPWKYVWLLRKEDAEDLHYHVSKAHLLLNGSPKPSLPHHGTILATLKSFLYPAQYLLNFSPN